MKAFIGVCVCLNSTTMKLYLIAFFWFGFVGVTRAQSDVKITKDSLPLQVKDEFEKKYQGYVVSKVFKAVGRNGVKTYRLVVRKAVSIKKTIIYDLLYDATGKLLSKKKDKEIFYTESPKRQKAPSHSMGDGHNH